MKSVNFRTRITSNGKLPVSTSDLIREYLTSNATKTIDISFKVVRENRSSKQNRYYHGCVVPIINQEFTNLGHRLTNEECHEFLKHKFNSRSISNHDGEFIGEIAGSTADLTTIEFNEYIEKIVQWAAEYLNVIIPEPEKQITIL